MIRQLLNSVLLLSALTISGCTVFPLPEPPRIMDLATDGDPTVLSKTHNASLRVETPLASAPFDGSRILIKPTPYEFQAIGEARWRDTAPVMIRDYVLSHVRTSQAFRNAIVDTSPASAELTLVSELTAFHVMHQNSELQVLIKLHTELVQNNQRESICVRNWSITEPVADSQHESIVQGFSNAAHRLGNDLTRWMAECADQSHNTAEN